MYCIRLFSSFHNIDSARRSKRRRGMYARAAATPHALGPKAPLGCDLDISQRRLWHRISSSPDPRAPACGDSAGGVRHLCLCHADPAPQGHYSALACGVPPNCLVDNPRQSGDERNRSHVRICLLLSWHSGRSGITQRSNDTTERSRTQVL